MTNNQPTPAPGMPRWVKIFVVILVVLILLVIVVHAMGFRVNHGTGEMLPGTFTQLIPHAALHL